MVALHIVFIIQLTLFSGNCLIAFNIGSQLLRRTNHVIASMNMNLNDIDTQIPEEYQSIASELRRYIDIRAKLSSDSNVDDSAEVAETAPSRNKSKPYNFFEMYKQSGWFVDKREVDLKKRMDTRGVPHPFSYAELKKYGFERLYDQIVSLGGAYAVASAIGYKWTEPKQIEEIWTEDQRPINDESFALDMKGSLSLGGALEDKLSEASLMDIESLKESLSKSREKESIEDSNQMTRELNESAFDDVSSYKNNRKVSSKSYNSKRFQKSLEIQNNVESIVKIDKFSLSLAERSFTIFSLLSFSVAHGRATDMLPLSIEYIHSIIDISEVVSLFMIGLSIASATLATRLANEKQRDKIIWGVTGLFGGPLVISRISNLKVVPKL